MYTDITHIALNYKYTLYTEVAYTNCLTSSLDIYVDKTLVSDFSSPFTHPFMDGRLYYSSSLSLNGNIDPTSISL